VGSRISKQAENPECLLVDCLHGTQQRRLLIQCFAAVRTECSRYVECHAQRIFPQKCRGSTIPGCIAACLKGGTKSARRKRGCIRLALNQLFTGKLHDNASVGIRYGDKRIMFFCRDAGQRLEPMGIMRRTALDRPVFHRVCDNICDGRIQLSSVFNGFLQFFVNTFRKAFLHRLVIKHIFSENFRYIDNLAHSIPHINMKTDRTAGMYIRVAKCTFLQSGHEPYLFIRLFR